MSLPAETLSDAFRVCHPGEPLQRGDPRYVDCSGARGEANIATTLALEIEGAELPTYQLVAGHRGCGKSTELLRLRGQLEEQGYFVVYFHAGEEIDPNDVVYCDVLLAILKRMAEQLLLKGIALDRNLMDDIVSWLAGVVLPKDERRRFDAEAKESTGAGVDAPFARLTAMLTGRIKTGVHSKNEIRQRLEPEISMLLDKANDLVDAAIVSLKEGGHLDMVVIVDSLDHCPFAHQEESTSHEALYIEHGRKLKAINCNIIYTVPISMCCSHEAVELARMFNEPYVIPVLRVGDRDGGDCEAGVAALTEVLSKRIVLDAVFEPGVPEMLCRLSGGNLKQLMALVRSSRLYATGAKIDEQCVLKAKSRPSNAYGRSVPAQYWQLLANVHRTKRVLNDVDHQAMLHDSAVLEYLDPQRWYDVNPILLELEELREYLR